MRWPVLGWIALVTLAAALINAVSLRPFATDSLSSGLPLLAGYSLLTVLALTQIRKQGRLGECFSLKGGDLSIGIMLGLLLLAMAWLLKTRLVPVGSDRDGWLFQIFTLVGPMSGNVWKTVTLVLVVAMEEVIWRGFVAHELSQKLGARRALPLAALLYALSVLPTAWTLADAVAGLNPLLVLAALGCGICWTFLALRSKRLFAVWISHAVFSYFAAAHLLVGKV
jgi:membrane protease YdiL (CAAX protease family)